MNLENKKILVTGGAGFLGSFVVEEFENQGAKGENIIIPRSDEHDLRKMGNCKEVTEGVDIVIHLAAKVGGIGLNRDRPGELFYDNAIMGIQLMEAARQNRVEKFVTAGTICSYPKFTEVPFKEEDLWKGYPEETNAPYGIAKKALLVQGRAFRNQYDFNAIYLMPVNLYGPRDDFDPESSHVIPALIKKIYEAKEEDKDKIVAWGTGKPTREFLYVEDAAKGIVKATKEYDKPDPVNLGSGMEISIKELVNLIADLMDYEGEIEWDTSKPDGQPRRSLDTSKAKKEFGFEADTDFKEGLRNTIDWYINERQD